MSVNDAPFEPEVVKNMLNLLSTLSSKDSLSIFLRSADGIRAESSYAKKMGLTKRKYYLRIRQLIDAGLISKADRMYSHTTLGRIIYQSFLTQLFETTKNKKSLQMIDSLKRSKLYSDSDISHFISKFARDSPTSSNDKVNNYANTKFFWNYTEMASWIIQRSHYAKQEILIATRIFDETIINAVSAKANAGISVRVMATHSMIRNFIQDEDARKMSSIDKNSDERTKVVTNPWYPNNVARVIGEVPFCMIIFDRKEAAVELIDSTEPTKVKRGFSFIDDDRAGELASFYLSVWDHLSQEESTTAEIKKARK